jgi:chromosomal replication initiator protein
MNLQTISELQGKTEILMERLLDAKENALDNHKKEPSMALVALIRASVIDINCQLSKDKDSSPPEKTITDKTILLEELKSILLLIDGIKDYKRKVKTRKREIVMSRQIIMAVYHRAIFSVSLKEAGNLYGKDHATVLHACKTISNLRDTDTIFNEAYSPVWDWATSQDPHFTLLPKGK